MNGIKTLGILRNRSGFTLAEMMVVMLILSIVMAAFAPIMTRRNKTDFKSPWATVNNDASGSIYFINSKVEDLASARIGFDGSYENLAGANYARLLINAKDGNWNALGFMYNGDQVGVINMRNNSSILIGTAGNYSNNLAYVPNHETSAIAYVRPIEYNYYAAGGGINGSCEFDCNSTYCGTALYECQNNTSYQNCLKNCSNNTSYSGGGNGGWMVTSSTHNFDNTDPCTGITNSCNSCKSAEDNNEVVQQNFANTCNNIRSKCSQCGYSYNEMTGVNSGSDIVNGNATDGNTSGNNSDDETTTTTTTLKLTNKLHTNVVGIGKSIISNGHESVLVGNNASAGIRSVSIGYSAQGNGSSDYTVAIGTGALNSNTANGMVAVGAGALNSNTSGGQNTAIGYSALKSNETGSYNVAVGYRSLETSNSNGNTALGHQSLLANTSGMYNTAVGMQTLYSNTTGYTNTAVGTFALINNTTGSSNIAIGYNPLPANTTGSNNIAIGNQALKSNTTGTGNIAIGQEALKSYTSTSSSYDSNNIAIGRNANQNVQNYVIETISIGKNSVASKNTAVALGANANSSGVSAISIGHNTAASAHAIAIGDGARAGGNNNIAVGYYHSDTDTAAQIGGSNNIGIGENACTNVTGNNKICIGNNSGPQSSDDTTDETVYIGGKSYFNGGDAVLEVHNPNYNNGTGYLQGWSKKDNSGEVDTSNPSSTVVINGNLVVKGLIMSRIGNGTVTDPAKDGYAKILFGTNSNGNSSFNDLVWKNGPGNSNAATTLNKLYGSTYGFRGNSDYRLKNITGANSDGLSKIQQLKVYNFTFKQDPKKMPHTGVIAQDLQKIFPNSVIKGEDGYLVIRWDEMFYAMINAVKELAAKINVIDSRVTRLEKENAELRARLLALEKKLK